MLNVFNPQSTPSSACIGEFEFECTAVRKFTSTCQQKLGIYQQADRPSYSDSIHSTIALHCSIALAQAAVLPLGDLLIRA
jgi:hypothetical protein